MTYSGITTIEGDDSELDHLELREILSASVKLFERSADTSMSMVCRFHAGEYALADPGWFGCRTAA